MVMIYDADAMGPNAEEEASVLHPVIMNGK